MKVYKVILFKAKNSEFCWRAIARNGRELFRASETYKNSVHAFRQADTIRRKFGCKYEEIDHRP